MNNLPTLAPPETVQINPEHLEIANLYLQEADIQKVADILDIPMDIVASSLERREVKAYIDRMYYDAGFNNRIKINQLMEVIIKKKLQELEEAGVGSNKDIVDLIMLQHKIAMDHRNAAIAEDKARGNTITNQTNIQVNEASKHETLITRILDAATKK